jgi:hypothetical protein
MKTSRLAGPAALGCAATLLLAGCADENSPCVEHVQAFELRGTRICSISRSGKIAYASLDGDSLWLGELSDSMEHGARVDVFEVP